ncbi:ATP-dependent nuclease [Aliarcobacter butzleri]|uniref:ATP-dependent nuclease n=1 Tax=Aliarcobacter butzleri TaxID=28197 RepID=UPI00125F726B|nr:AAA family ATPase [Aliarcobacter butzleri]
MYIKNVEIKNFRTFDSYDEKGKDLFNIELDEKFQIIAGANNSGKTNLLRALNLFFNYETDENITYSRYQDMPYHKGKDGTGSPVYTEITVQIFLTDNDVLKIRSLKKFLLQGNLIIVKIIFKNEEIIKMYMNEKKSFIPLQKSHHIQKLLNRVKFVYIPSNTIIEKKINELVSDEILPSMIDSYGYGKSDLGKKIRKLSSLLKESDILTKEILEEKNKYLTDKFVDVIKTFPEITAGIDLSDFSLEVEIIDESMANILSKRITLSVKDSSHDTVESKGSGIQKLALISLLDYFSDYNEEKARFTNPFLIWAIDEPETFLQPKLQKKLREIFEKVSQKHQIIITTHSPKLIDINNTDNVKLFMLETLKTTPITRKNMKILTKKMTKFIDKNEIGFLDKLKEHLGVEKNDGWVISDKNILFEGEDDKIFFDSTFELIMGYKLDYSKISTNSSENMPNFVELLNNEFTEKKSKIICLLDNDMAGNKAFKKIKDKKGIRAFKTISLYLKEAKIDEILNKEYESSDKKMLIEEYKQLNKYKIVKKLSDEEQKNYMIEDMVIPEIYYNAVILYLESILKYEIKKYSFEDFFIERQKYLGITITELLNNYFSELREKNKIDFTSLHTKYAISVKYKNLINSIKEEQLEIYRKKYNTLEDFFKGFL